MSSVKLIQMYASPWAERVRWALNFKGVPYEKQNYQPGVDEEAVRKLTGQAQVPVLLVNGTVIPDSTAILNWLEQYTPATGAHASVRERSGAGDDVGGADGRGPGSSGADAHHWAVSAVERAGICNKADNTLRRSTNTTPYAEEHAKATVERTLTILKHALDGHEYLVGDAFTRADLTTASMFLLVNPPPDDLFVFPASMRPMYTAPLTSNSAFAPIFAWRDKMYRKHRGETVKP